MGNLKIGNSSVTLKLGSADVSAAYLGNTLVYSGGTPPTPVLDTKFFATYSDNTTYSAACDSDTELTSATTKAHTTSYTGMTTAEIGSSCITSIGNYAFQDCSSLTSIDIPNSVTSIGNNAFKNCSSLTSVTIPNGVTNINDNAFSFCESLSSIDIPSGATRIGNNTFRDCTSLTSITIGNGVTSIGNQAFQDCESLSSIDIPSGVTSIGGGAFYRCTNLTSITIEATTPPTLGRYVFNNTNCPIYVPSESVETYKAASGWSYYASRIQAIPTPVLDTKFFATYSDSTTYSAACDSDTELTTATTQAHTTSYDLMTSAEIGSCITTTGEDAFADCESLSSVTIPNSVTYIGTYAFFNCTSLTSIDIPNSVTSIGDNALQYCTSLTSVTIGNGVTSIGDWAFRGCESLSSVTIEATTPPTIGGGAFEDTNDCTIYVPSESVETYKSASGWSDYASRIQAIP